MARRGRGRKKGPRAIHAIPARHANCNHGQVKVKYVKRLLRPAWTPGKRVSYVCGKEGCGAKFTDRNNFCQHQQDKKHYGYRGWRPMWVCGLCRKWSVTQGLLILHIRGCHSCFRCGKIVAGSCRQ